MAAQGGQQELGALVECLRNSLSGHDRNKQKEAELVGHLAQERLSANMDWLDS